MENLKIEDIAELWKSGNLSNTEGLLELIPSFTKNETVYAQIRNIEDTETALQMFLDWIAVLRTLILAIEETNDCPYPLNSTTVDYRSLSLNDKDSHIMDARILYLESATPVLMSTQDLCIFPLQRLRLVKLFFFL